MKIEFDKALLWLLPYLYVVSVAYYWGYWGTFNVDIFNYYPVSDLVKGVTAPLGSTLLLVTVLGFIMTFVSNQLFGPFSLRKTIIIILCSITLLIIAYSLPHFYASRSPLYEVDGVEIKDFARGFIGIALATFIITQLPEMTGLYGALRNSTVLLVVFLPFQAYIDGKDKAILIQVEQEFDYIVTDSIAKPQNIYKYLGKAGDYQILLSQDNNKRIIISAGKLDPLIIEKYTWRYSASIRRFKAYQKYLPTVAAPK